jgi:hypothetical protein
MMANKKERATHRNGNGKKRGDGIGAAIGGVRLPMRFLLRFLMSVVGIMMIVMMLMAHGFSPRKLGRQSSGAGRDFNDSSVIKPATPSPLPWPFPARGQGVGERV